MAGTLATTTPSPAQTEFSLTSVQTWSMLHWIILGMGGVILILLAYILYQYRKTYTTLPQAKNEGMSARAYGGSDGGGGDDEQQLLPSLASCPPDRRMQMLSRYV